MIKTKHCFLILHKNDTYLNQYINYCTCLNSFMHALNKISCMHEDHKLQYRFTARTGNTSWTSRSRYSEFIVAT